MNRDRNLFLTFCWSLAAAALLGAGPARAESDDGAPADDVVRTVEFGPEIFGGFANHEHFDSGHGGFGIAARVKDVVTLRARAQFLGSDAPAGNPQGRDDGWAATFGMAVHPFKFYNRDIGKFWVEPYFAADVGPGTLFGQGGQFLLADFLWGVNFDIDRPLVLFFEGGLLYLNFDDKDPQPQSVLQGEFQGGLRFFF